MRKRFGLTPLWTKPILAKYKPQKTSEGIAWTIEEHHSWMAKGGPCYSLFTTLQDRLATEFPSWKEDVKKYYVSYKSGKKLTLSVQDRKTGKLVLGLRGSIEEFSDPKGLCVDKRSTGGIGPGMSTMVTLEDASGLNDVIEPPKTDIKGPNESESQHAQSLRFRPILARLIVRATSSNKIKNDAPRIDSSGASKLLGTLLL